MSTSTCEKLHRRLRIQTGKMDELFGRIHIIFAGDFFQIPPVCEESKALYNGCCLQWNPLTDVIILENNHRFVKNPDYGLMLERIAKGEATENYSKLINSRVMTKSHIIIKDFIDQ